METEENGIVSLDHKSCASITVQCLVDAGVTDFRTPPRRKQMPLSVIGLHMYGFVGTMVWTEAPILAG